MDSSHDQARTAFQGEIDSVYDGGTLQLLPREYPGPIIIKRPLILDGQGATIWALKGPVVSIQSDSVTLRNLKIEVTSEDGINSADEACAIIVKSVQHALLEHIEVRGSVIGLPEEEGMWRYPNVLHIGQLAHGTEHDFKVRLVAPVPCRITSNISGLTVEPRSLTPGAHEVRIHIERLAQDTLLTGTFSISTAFLTRRIMVSAHIVSSQNAPTAPVQGRNQIIWEPQDWSSLVAGPKPTPKPPEPVPVTPPPKTQPIVPPSTLPVPPQYSESPVTAQPIQSPVNSAPSASVPPPPQPVSPSPTRIRRQSSPLNEKTFLRPAETKASLDTEANDALSTSKKADAAGVPKLSPLFSEQKKGSQKAASGQDQSVGTKQETTPSAAQSPSRRVKSKPIGSLFEQASANSNSETEEKLDKPQNQESKPADKLQENSKLTKKIVRPGGLSKLFENNDKKEHKDGGAKK